MSDNEADVTATSLRLDDAAWCWWTRPRAQVVDGRLYVAALDSSGGVFVATESVAGGGEVARVELARLEDDDHNNPAILVDPHRPVVAFYSRHDAEDLVRYRVSAAAGDITTWGPERTVRFPGVTSYAQVHPVGDTIHLFTRAGVTTWAHARSDDWGATWCPSRPFIALDTDQEVYMPTALLADGTTLRVAITGHPKEYEQRPEQDIWVCVADLTTGEVSLPSSGRVVADLLSGAGLPLTAGELELAAACPPGRTVNLFDVGSGPAFEIGFASKRRGDRDTVDARYLVATLDDGAWMVDDLVAAGDIFGYIDAGMYVGGVTFAHGAAGRLALSREDGGVWYLEEWSKDAGERWAGTPLAMPSPTRLVRPWAASGADLYLALELERYGDSYEGTLSHAVGLEPRVR